MNTEINSSVEPRKLAWMTPSVINFGTIEELTKTSGIRKWAGPSDGSGLVYS